MNTEKELSNELHNQVDRMGGSPISFDDVLGTAGKIRRRRRAVTGLAALAAAAVIVPSAMFGGGLFDNDSAPSPVAPVTRTVSDAVLDPALPAGDPPKLGYVDAQTVVTSSGETFQVDKVYDTPQRAGDEYLTAYGFEGGDPEVDVLDTQWKVTDTFAIGSGPVSSADGTVAAWTQPDGTVGVRYRGQSATLGRIDGDYPQVVAIRGYQTCKEGSPEAPTGCTVYANVQDGPAVRTDSTGTVEEVPGGFSLVAAVSTDGLVAGRVTPMDVDATQPSCSAVYDEVADEQVFETCDLAFNYSGGFSPDARFLVGSAAGEDTGPTSLEVIDVRIGTTSLRINLAGAVQKDSIIAGAVWEDDEHLIIKTQGPADDAPASYNLYRVGLDGTVERMLERDYVGDGGEIQPWMFFD